ncbi:MAG TPA: response regulator transcription factor [Saprospiraceae bacterium]|nr:response regulator transcription factor [Saprospiraceae bacterium]HMQ81615.1 response regulator transcription factor [Saprospiraceae bacterium]
MKAHLLYVEDDESLSFVTKDNLELNGYQICYCENGQKAVDAIQRQDFDLCILDVMLPDIDGFALAKTIRAQNTHVPILFLTAKSLKEDRLEGLRLGADDYITKPFSIEELILKIEVFLRRSKITQVLPQDQLQIGHYTLDHRNQLLKGAKGSRQLTQREADLLKLLIENKNQVLPRGGILTRLWGEDDYFLGRSLDVFISRLRKYLSDDASIKIENIHGVGFRLSDDTL